MSGSPDPTNRVAVIMAGGRGTRFWPRSRSRRPKQFLNMVGEKSLLRQTVARLEPVYAPERIFVVTTDDLAEGTLRILPELQEENLILEPQGRNTAPCLALALVLLERKFPGSVMTVLAADHWIGERNLFLNDLTLATRHAAEHHQLITFGVKPTYPETGYGYIETSGEGSVLQVKAFKEKPPVEVALQYLVSEHHYWNSGMFVWTLEDLRKGLEAHCPEVLAPLDAWMAQGGKDRALEAAYAKLPKISIDYALMEKAPNVACVPAHFRWSDVGSWPSVMDFHPKDAHGNVVQGQAVLMDVQNCAVFGSSRMVAVAGLSDLFIVDEPDALLICRKDLAQDVRGIVQRLEKMGRHDLL